ncbi:uncharacterized protein LOC115322727 isoform X2 [Ixodes scapularis]|uniref:uncharacterized protein LOC115322727 isoform X2 n=1 Tax=Ixodes scapularis TaxID=6945 RepID=UPI001A9FA174|nr:uncharacterized protein LOC115322727 isoform X2 [Ixodes scapularis]
MPCFLPTPQCATTCGSAVDAGGAVGPYCLTLADEDILAKNEIVDPSIGLQKRKEWLLLTTPEGERYHQAERAARHQKIRRYLSEKLPNLKRNHYKGSSLCCLSSPDAWSHHGLPMLLQVCHRLHPML